MKYYGLEEIGLSKRTFYCLKRHAISTIEQLLELSEDAVLAMKGAGPCALKEIISAQMRVRDNTVNLKGCGKEQHSILGKSGEVQYLSDGGELIFSNLGLSKRAYHCLIRSNITSIEKLQNITEENLHLIRNAGEKTVKEIMCLQQKIKNELSNTVSDEEKSDIESIDTLCSFWEWLDSQPGREAQVIRMRMDGATLQTVAHYFRISRERVRQIQNGVIKRIPSCKEDKYKYWYSTYDMDYDSMS